MALRGILKRSPLLNGFRGKEDKEEYKIDTLVYQTDNEVVKVYKNSELLATFENIRIVRTTREEHKRAFSVEDFEIVRGAVNMFFGKLVTAKYNPSEDAVDITL